MMHKTKHIDPSGGFRQTGFHFAVIYAHAILQIRHFVQLYISTEDCRCGQTDKRIYLRVHIDAVGEKMTGD